MTTQRLTIRYSTVWTLWRDDRVKREIRGFKKGKERRWHQIRNGSGSVRCTRSTRTLSKSWNGLSSLNGDRSASRTLENLIMDAQIQDDSSQPPTGE